MTDIDLRTIQRAQAGDQEAARRIIEVLHRPVIATIYRLLGSGYRADVEDIAQEVFLKVFRAIDRFEPERGVKFSTWVYTFVRNHCFDVLRRRRRDMAALGTAVREDDLGIEPADPDAVRPNESALNQELGRKIEEALAGLGADQRLAFVLREYEGLDYASIAQVLGISEGTVKSRIHRAKETLRSRLMPYVNAGSR